MQKQDELVSLTPDQKAVLARASQDLAGGIATLREMGSKGTLTKQLAHSILYVAESTVVDICKLTGVETDGAATREQRFADIRAANVKIRKLERLLGEKLTATATAASISNLGERLAAWWRAYGFGHISECSFSQYGSCQVTFSCHLFGRERLTSSRTPVTDKQTRAEWLQGLRDLGYAVNDEEGGDHEALVDCDNSRRLVSELIRTHMPSARVTSIHNRSQRSQVLVLRDVEVSIGKIADIENLDIPFETADA